MKERKKEEGKKLSKGKRSDYFRLENSLDATSTP